MNESYLTIAVAFVISTAVFAQRKSELNGAVSLECSGSIVRLGRAISDRALLLTNGHCLLHGTIAPGTMIQGLDYLRGPISVLNEDGKEISLNPSKIIYGTMDSVDQGIIELHQTYEELSRLKVRTFEISSAPPGKNEAVWIMSGYWKERTECSITSTEVTVKEGVFLWPKSFALDSKCVTKPGWSGSPVISKATGKIIGTVNTGGDRQDPCLFNHPCEVQGTNTKAFKRSYGQFTTDLMGCFSQGAFSLAFPTCHLQKKNFFADDLSLQKKLELLKKLVGSYPNLELAFDETVSNLGTSPDGSIRYNNSILQSFPINELLFFVCHEIGHHFGDIKNADTQLAVEAEADYFGGHCLQKFLQIEVAQAERIIVESFQELVNNPISVNRARSQKFAGIDQNYPDGDCRALSATNGVRGLPRPACWYNP